MLVALAWLAFLACNRNDQLLAPAKGDLLLPSKFQPTETKSSGDDLATMCQRDKYEIGTSSAIIGPAGGVLTRGNHRLVIPVGALSQTIKITFTMLASAYLECELKPYGFKFNTPVRLVLSYNGACDDNLDESALKVAYYSSKTQLGVLTPTAIDTALNTVTVELEKFAFGTSSVTRYALIKR
jgi:hypothetical protein